MPSTLITKCHSNYRSNADWAWSKSLIAAIRPTEYVHGPGEKEMQQIIIPDYLKVIIWMQINFIRENSWFADTSLPSYGQLTVVSKLADILLQNWLISWGEDVLAFLYDQISFTKIGNKLFWINKIPTLYNGWVTISLVCVAPGIAMGCRHGTQPRFSLFSLMI